MPVTDNVQSGPIATVQVFITDSGLISLLCGCDAFTSTLSNLHAMHTDFGSDAAICCTAINIGVFSLPDRLVILHIADCPPNSALHNRISMAIQDQTLSAAAATADDRTDDRLTVRSLSAVVVHVQKHTIDNREKLPTERE